MVFVEEEEDELIRCRECGHIDRRYDPCAWESCCANCGLVDSYEYAEDINYTFIKPKTYYKHNYFVGSILKNVMENGFKPSRHEMYEMERLYKICVQKYYETQHIHKRKYMINTMFTLSKICERMRIDVSPFIKLPKKDTIVKLEKDWKIMNAF
jgi:hypothetical protein